MLDARPGKGDVRMHESSVLRMKWFVDRYASQIPKSAITVLDVGSQDINGTYKHLFPESKYRYTGLDMQDGPNVDVVLPAAYDWDAIATDSFDVVISGQAFEHIEFFWITMAEMARVLKRDGLLCLIAPNGFGEHRFPVDCYRFFTDGMVALARYVRLDILHAHTNCAPNAQDSRWYSDTCGDSMLVAKKPYDGATKFPIRKAYACIPAVHDALRDNFVPPAGNSIHPTETTTDPDSP